jgi:hypothetical protein
MSISTFKSYLVLYIYHQFGELLINTNCHDALQRQILRGAIG